MRILLIAFILSIYGCDAPKDFITNQIDDQVETIAPFTDNCFWHDGVYQYIVNEDKPDRVICNDGAEFDVVQPDTIYTDLFRD